MHTHLQAEPNPQSTQTLNNLSAMSNTLIEPILKNFYTIASESKNLNYYTSKDMVLPIPGTKQEVVLSWGFAASGNMFTPLPELTVNFRATTQQYTTDSESSTGKRICYALIQDKLNQSIKDNALTKILTQPELNPIILFGLKTMLLFKTTLSTQNSNSNVYANTATELMRLLFRLKLSHEYHDAKISTLLPGQLRQTIESLAPGSLDFIDELWTQMSSNEPMTHGTKSYSITCFVFRDKEFAENMAKKFELYKNNFFLSDATELISSKSHQVVDFSQFAKYTSQEDVKTSHNLGKNLVGFLSTINANHKDIPLAVKNTFEQLTKFPATKLVADDHGNQWLIHVNQTLGNIDSIKATLLSLTQALHNYMALKQEMLNRTDAAAVEYRKQCQAREHATEVLQNFFEQQDGARSLERLLKEIQAITQPIQTTINTLNKAHAQRDELFAATQKLEQKIQALRLDLDRYTILKKATPNQALNYQKTIDQTTAAIAATTEKIAQKKAQIKLLEDELVELENSPEVKQEQNTQTLAALQKLAQQQQAHDGKISQELEIALASLKKTTTQQSNIIDIEARLAKRSKIAKAFTAEAETMDAQLAQELKKLQTIEDRDQRTIQELLFDATRTGYTTYITHLRTEAQRILDENEKAATLNSRKKAFASGSVMRMTKEQETELQTLEENVGHILTSTQEEDFVATLKHQHADIRELFTDINTFEAFKSIKSNLIESLANIAKNSEFVQKHTTLCNEFMQIAVARHPILAPIAKAIV